MRLAKLAIGVFGVALVLNVATATLVRRRCFMTTAGRSSRNKERVQDGYIQADDFVFNRHGVLTHLTLWGSLVGDVYWALFDGESGRPGLPLVQGSSAATSVLEGDVSQLDLDLPNIPIKAHKTYWIGLHGGPFVNPGCFTDDAPALSWAQSAENESDPDMKCRRRTVVRVSPAPLI